MSQKPDPMEYIWSRLPKQDGGKTVQYLPGDIPYLYYNGFVDTQKYSYKQWETAFTPFKQTDGNYLLDKSQFMSLRVFRYYGPSHAIFDPFRLREGPWPDDELEHLYLKSIKPSSSISEKVYWTAIGALKKQGKVNEENELVIDEKVKQQLNYLLEKFPSPRRRLEKEVARIKKEKEEELLGASRDRDKSKFGVGKTKGEKNLDQFKKLESSADTQNNLVDENKETVDLKSLRKPNHKFMG